METVFLEATLQLVAPESSLLSDGQANAVEILVFDWVLHAEKFVDSKHSELLKARERVCSCPAHSCWTHGLTCTMLIWMLQASCSRQSLKHKHGSEALQRLTVKIMCQDQNCMCCPCI